jgi:hypothetical protein
MSLRPELIDALPYMPSDALRVLLVLMDRHRLQLTTKVGLSITELARTADLGVESTARALLWLSDPNANNHPDRKTQPTIEHFIVLTKRSNRYDIQVSPFWLGRDAKPIPFTYDNTDQTKIATIEKELRRIATDTQRGQVKSSSGLTSILKGEERLIVDEIERDLGRGLSPFEIWAVSEIVEGYGPERTKMLWRGKAHLSENPIRTIYALYQNAKFGKSNKKVERGLDEVVYREL